MSDNQKVVGLAYNLIGTLHTAKTNGHLPGHIFNDSICFCQRCNAPLTFQTKNEGKIQIAGLSGGLCLG